MIGIDPDRIQSWLKLGAGVGAAAIAVGAWVLRVEAQGTVIVKNVEEIVQIKADVVDIKQLLAENRAQSESERRDEQSRMKLTVKFCKQEAFRIANPVRCIMAEDAE